MMTVEDFKVEGKLIFNIRELTGFGEEDKFKKVTVSLDKIVSLPRITAEEVNKLPKERFDWQEAEIVTIPELGGMQMVFINQRDLDNGAMSRSCSHDVIGGPYVLVASQKK